jgi:hypothetical protein
MLQSIGLTHSMDFEQYEYMPSYRCNNRNRTGSENGHYAAAGAF